MSLKKFSKKLFLFQVISDLSDNLVCLNGKLAALNKFINQLKELDNWVIKKKSEREDNNQKEISERKLAIEKLQVIIFYLIIQIMYFYIL